MFLRYRVRLRRPLLHSNNALKFYGLVGCWVLLLAIAVWPQREALFAGKFQAALPSSLRTFFATSTRFKAQDAARAGVVSSPFSGLATATSHVAAASAQPTPTPVPVSTVSAASFEPTAIAPESIVAAFSTGLATRTEAAVTSPLPILLAGTQVKIKDEAGVERPAPLFFVSPGQVNYLIPAGTTEGTATVRIQSGDGTISTGQLQIRAVAPAIFTADGSGNGVPAAIAQRYNNGSLVGNEPISYYDADARSFAPLPIKPPGPGEQVFLILYLSGIRGAAQGAVKVLLGGQSATPPFAPAPGFSGLEQVNVAIPRELFERGRLDLLIEAGGVTTKITQIETGCPPGSGVAQVNGYNPLPSLAGQPMTITGSGFETELTKNLVRIAGIEAKVLSATTGLLTVRVPFGVASGPLTVCLPTGEYRNSSQVTMRTSVSGFVEDTRGQPLAGVIVRMKTGSTDIQDVTNAEGSFILRDVPPGSGREIDFYSTNLPGAQPPNTTLKRKVLPDSDNTFDSPISLQPPTGPSLLVGTGTLAQSNITGRLAGATPSQQPGNSLVQTEGIIFEVAGGTRAMFPDNSTSGRLTLTAVENSRTPIPLPPGFFSSSVAQISPYDVRLSPGAKLTFPNSDNIPPGKQVKLYKFDQRAGSPTIGSFTEVAGGAIVSVDGKRVETAQNAITDTSIYFVAAPRLATTVVGRVVDGDGSTPVRLARVRSRGQEAFTDGNGGFVLRNLVAGEGDFLTVDASFQRANGAVDRAQTILTPAVVGGITNVDVLKLSAENSNRKPTILAPSTLAVNVNEKRDLIIVVSDPDPNQTVEVSVSGANFAMPPTPIGNSLYILKLMPGAGDAGSYMLEIIARDNLGEVRKHIIALKVNRLPVATRLDVITLDEDTSRQIMLLGSDPDGDSLIFLIVQNPGNGRLSGVAPNLIYTPNPNYFGTDSFRFIVNDGVGDSAPEQVTIGINPVNDPPVLNVPGAQTVDAGKILSFIVSATDEDDTEFTFTATGRPAGATFSSITPNTAQFSWTPSAAQVGTHLVTFIVKDKALAPDSKTVMITVKDVNRAPSLDILPPQTISSGRQLNIVLTATDPNPGQKLTFSSPNRPAGSELDPDSGRFTWTPSFLQLGVTTVTFKVTDNGEPPLSAMQTLTITVNGQWTQPGRLEGGQIHALFSHNTNLFAGVQGGGIFRSTDQGQRWVQVRNNQTIQAFAVIGDVLFAGDFGGGVYRSDNQGLSWSAVNNGLTNRRVLSLIVNEQTLLAGTQGGGVYRSTNQGQSWTPANDGLNDLRIFALAVMSDGSLFAGTRGRFFNGIGGIYRSTDNGRNWMAVSNGLTDPMVYTLAVRNNVLFAGTHGGGVFRWMDQGQTWVPVNNGLLGDNGLPLQARSLLARDNDMLAGTPIGIFRSTDEGQNWIPLNPPINAGLRTLILSMASSGANLFAGTNGAGVFRSLNNAPNLSAANTGLTAMIVNAIATKDTNILVGTQRSGVHLSYDNGRSWTASRGLEFQDVNALVVSGAAVLAGTGDRGVFRSLDGGQNWSAFNTGVLDGVDVRALADSNGTLFAGTADKGIFRLTAQGQTWTRINAGLKDLSINVLAVSRTGLLAGTGEGVFRLPEGEQTWVPINTSGLIALAIRALTLNGDDLFVGTDDGVFRLTSSGQNWEQVLTSAGLPADGIAALIANEGNLFAGGDSVGVYFSTNNGERWSEVNAGFETLFVKSFAVVGKTLYAGTVGGGVFVGQ